jgi:hypothetical protein
MAQESIIGVSATAEEVFQRITAAGVSKADAAVVVGSWIIENAGRAPRVFSYRTAFPASDPACTSQFVRTFLHQDWVDGEDVVQAEQTTGEEGFNLRFHRIESDLDSLARDVATAFVCLASMRASLRQLLDEIRTELNAINLNVADCCAPTRRPPFTIEGGGTRFGRYVGGTKFFSKDVNVFETDQGLLLLPAVSGIKIDPTDNPRVKRVSDFAKFLTDERVAKFFADEQTVTRDKFVEKFGDEVLESGVKVGDLVDILPSSARFTSPDSMLDGLAKREAAAIRTSPIEGEAIAASLGVESGEKIADAPVDRLEAIPRATRNVLAAAGVSQVGVLAGRDPVAVAAELRTRGVDVTTRDVAGWVAAAKTLVNVR